MHLTYLPVCCNSVAWIKHTALVITNNEAAAVANKEPELSLPSNDDLSSLSSLPLPLSSPDLLGAAELLGHHKRPEDGCILPLPRSSPPTSSLGPDGEQAAMEYESLPGQVHLFEKAGSCMQMFSIPSTNGFFSILNSGRFVKHTRVIMHPLEVYDPMMGNFIHLPPTAYWRQHSSHHYLILWEQGLNDEDCPGLEELIENLGNPVDIMSADVSCVKSWHQDGVKTPPCGQPRLPSSSPAQSSSDSENVEEIAKVVQIAAGRKRKLSTPYDSFPGPPRKLLKFNDKGNGDVVEEGSKDAIEGGSGDTVLDPIFIMEGGTGTSVLDPIFFMDDRHTF